MKTPFSWGSGSLGLQAKSATSKSPLGRIWPRNAELVAKIGTTSTPDLSQLRLDELEHSGPVARLAALVTKRSESRSPAQT